MKTSTVVGTKPLHWLISKVIKTLIDFEFLFEKCYKKKLLEIDVTLLILPQK
jgi:hypothetical protein